MITVISGTTRPNSRTLIVATHYYNQLKINAPTLDISLLSLESLPKDIAFADFERKDFPAMPEIRTLMKETEKFVFIAPEYNGSYAGILKVFIDSLEVKSGFHYKKAALVGLALGKFGNLRGLDHLAATLNYVRVTTLPNRVHIEKIDKQVDENKNLTNESTLQAIDTQINELIKF